MSSGGEAGRSSRIRVVIADDYSPFRQALQRVIDAEADMVVVSALDDGRTAMDEIRRLAPDVAVLDVRMPGLDGIDVARSLVDDRLPVRTIIVTVHWDRLVVDRAVAAGVRGFMVKDTALADIVDAVHTVVRGETFVARTLPDLTRR